MYNLPQWTLGFTDRARQLYGDYHAAVGYCCKYIGKQDAERPLGRMVLCRRRGSERARQSCTVTWITRAVENSVEFSIPGAKLKISHDLRRKKAMINERKIGRHSCWNWGTTISAAARRYHARGGAARDVLHPECVLDKGALQRHLAAGARLHAVTGGALYAPQRSTRHGSAGQSRRRSWTYFRSRATDPDQRKAY